MILLSLIFILTSSAVTIRQDKAILYGRTSIIILISTLLVSYSTYSVDFLSNGIGVYHGFFQDTSITHTFHMFILIISALILQLNSFYPRKLWTEKSCSMHSILFTKIYYINTFILNKIGESYRILEYPLIILFVISGGLFLVNSYDIISVFLCIELQSYGLYILCSVYKESEKATSAGLTYFLLGGLSSCFILFSFSILYANSGNTSFEGINVITTIYSAGFSSTNEYENFSYIYDSNYIDFAFVIMSIGFLFKVTAAPFHFWSPDVYDAIPTIVTTFVAIFAKISIFILMLELIYCTNISFSFDYGNTVSSFGDSWKYTLLVSALVSFIIGSILGMTQFRIKRLYAYSTISHVGFILLALTINSMESIQSFMFYLIQYSLSNLNAFLLLLAIGYTLYMYIDRKEHKLNNENNKSTISVLSEEKNSPIQLISQLQGFFFINPSLALSLAITIFSFVGIPPLIGFFGKQMVLSSALDNGYIFITFVAILTSVISAYYYLSLIKNIFFYNTDYTINPFLSEISIKGNIVNTFTAKTKTVEMSTENIVLSGSLSLSISILTLMILLFILNPQQWLSMINILSLIFFNN